MNIEPIIRPIDMLRDLDMVIEIWYEGSLDAHGFIEQSFWEDSKPVMRDLYIPMANTMVLELGGRIIGFVSVFENKLAALFVSTKQQGNGYGKALLQWAFDNYDFLTLTVYEKNIRAMAFYKRNGFVTKSLSPDPHTGEPEWTMEWRKETNQG